MAETLLGRGMTLKIHIVQKGDTLWKIAEKYGVNFEELKKANSQLSNPDMIMPGMKIKVPTSGVPVQKEGAPSPGIKEMPKVQHPYSDQSTKAYPVTEIDESPDEKKSANQPAQTPFMQPIKEAPIAQPKKEAPIAQPKKEAPIAQPKKEAPVAQPKKEAPIAQPKKEMPVAPKLPKLKPIAPEIDINNYYTVNMAMQAPKKEAPKELPKHESPESPEMESIEMPPQMPCYPIMPISPVMPGYGFNYMPCHPPMYAPQPYPMPMYQQAPMYHHGYENESFEEHAMGAHMAPMPMYPMMPHSCYGPVQCSPCPPPWGYQQPVYPAYHQAPMYPQVQGAMTGGHYESSSDGFGNAPYHYGQHYAPQQQGDCGCGEPRPDDYAPQQPYPQYQQQVPYGFQDPRAPYPAPYGMIGVPPYPAFDPNAFSIPEYDEYDEDED